MESIPQDSLFEFNPDTLAYLRKQYNLEKPGRIEEAISLLEEWIKKQNHFLVREFPRDYLERSIILSKGSVERAKTKLDRICTFRTILPHFFEDFDIKNSTILHDWYGVFLPKLTKDHYRVYLCKNTAKTVKSDFLDFYRFLFWQLEYLQDNDYCNGIVFIADHTEANLLELVKWFSAIDLKEGIMIIKEGYGMRIKGLHIVTPSKAVDALVAVFKQVLSSKLAGRLYVHKTMDEVEKYVGKDIIPVEYGGKERPLLELKKKTIDILTSDSFTEHMEKKKQSRTNEKLRLSTSEADQNLGISGSFRTLSVD